MNRPWVVFHLNLRDPAQCRAVCILKAGDMDATQRVARNVAGRTWQNPSHRTVVPAELKPKKAEPKATSDFFSALQLDEPE